MSTVIAGWWQRRRLVVLAAAIVIAATVSLIVALSPGRATSGGDPYSVPGVVDTNPDPNIVETTLVSDEATVDIGNGVTALAQTFNGTLPGPTFRMKVGDTVIVHYENHLERPSAIHWHGIELANGMDGTPFTQNQVAPGGTFLYKFTVTRPGLYWYHPHHHSSTNQVFKGLYGMIIVTDPNEAALQASHTIPSAADTHAIVLSDTTVCKQPPNNDTATYDPSLPHVSGGMLPVQAGPTPKTLCETSPIDENGDPHPPYAAGDIPSIQTKATAGRTNEGQTVLTNGKNVGGRAGTPAAPGALAPGASTLDVQARQGVRLQLLNAAAIRYMRLRLTTSTGVQVPLTRIGGEGGLLDKAVTEGGVPGGFDTQYLTGEILLPPGTRADVAFGIPASATGVLTLWTEDYGRTGPNPTIFANTPTVPVMHFSVNGSAGSTYDIAGGDPIRDLTGDHVEQLGVPVNLLLNPAGFAPAKKGLASQQIALTVTGSAAGINGIFGTHDVGNLDYTDADHLDSSRYAKEGDLLQLDVQNMTGAHHPFHLHGFSIQPRTLTKAGGPNFTWPYPEFRDNVDIPPGYVLTFRIRLDPRPMPDGTTTGGALGRWVFHCHIFFHATNGMLSELVVTSASGNERPDVNVAGSLAQVEQDQQATIDGAYKDRDGDPVTLTASKGTVTDNGGGKWSWKDVPTAADSSGLIFVTATDSGGLKGQTAFQLEITNTPPTLVLPGAQATGVGDAPNFSVAATDPNTSDPITLSASGLPGGLTFTDNGNRTGTVSGNVTAAPGQYVATFSTNDGKHAAVTGTVPITVTPTGALTAVVSRPERLVKRAITVGCRLGIGSFKSCRASVLRGTSQVGQATTTLPAAGTTFANVRVPLNKATRRRVARSIPGVPVAVNFLALTFESPANLTASKKTRVVAPRVVARPKFAIFKPGSAKPTARGKRFLKKIAKQVKKARRIDCIAHAPFAKRRAAAGCAILRKAGLRAKYKRVRARSRSNRMQVAILR
jgi:FtsP/CotA-like multicopper oxidase with cupredoxin domain